jgi:hypothetical protein
MGRKAIPLYARMWPVQAAILESAAIEVTTAAMVASYSSPLGRLQRLGKQGTKPCT